MKTNEEASSSQHSAPISRRDLFVTTAIATAGLTIGASVSAASQNLPTGGTTSNRVDPDVPIEDVAGTVS